MSDRLQFILGVDLGQTNDPTAIVAVEVSGKGSESRFDVRHLERHLGKPYTFIVERVKALTERLEKQGDVTIGFDQTGVGRAVADMLRAAGISAPLYGVSITSGEAVTSEGNDSRVPKKDLVSVLQVAFQNGRIRIAKALALAEAMTRELLNFKVKVTAAANETFEAWRAGDHDDFVIALAIAVWLHGRGRGDGLFQWYEAKNEAQRRAELEYYWRPRTTSPEQLEAAIERELEQDAAREAWNKKLEEESAQDRSGVPRW